MDVVSSPPMLKLAVENVHQLDPVTVQQLWSACRNVSSLLENGPRLENLSDRLWFKQSPQHPSKPSPSQQKADKQLIPATSRQRKTHQDAEPPPSVQESTPSAVPHALFEPVHAALISASTTQKVLELVLPMDLANHHVAGKQAGQRKLGNAAEVSADAQAIVDESGNALAHSSVGPSVDNQLSTATLSPSSVVVSIENQQPIDEQEYSSDVEASTKTQAQSQLHHSHAKPGLKRPHPASHRSTNHRGHTVQRASASKQAGHDHSTGIRRNASSKSVRILEHTEAVPRTEAPAPSIISPDAQATDLGDAQAHRKPVGQDRLPPVTERKASFNPVPITSAKSRPSSSSLTSLEPRSVVKGFDPTPNSSAVNLSALRAKDEEDKAAKGEESAPDVLASSLSFAKRPISQVRPQSPAPPPSASTSKSKQDSSPSPDPPHVSIQPPTNGQSSKKGGRHAKKSMFFISSPSSESDGESIMRTLATKDKKLATPNVLSQERPVVSIGAAYATSPARPSSLRNESLRAVPRPPVAKSPAPDPRSASDVDDDGDSSGWGSEASSQSAASAPNDATTSKLEPRLFLKRTPTAPGDLARVNSRTGLLTQLFKPSEDDEKAVAGLLRNPSAVGLVLAARSKSSNEALPARRGLQPSKSATALPVMSYSGEDAFPKMTSTAQKGKESQKVAPRRLGGRPDDVEMSDSEGEDDGDRDEADQGLVGISPTQQAAFNAAMARYQARNMPVAGPQTPRTTRRNMLSTELSESLRLGLLWDRQTTMNLLGKPTKVRIPPIVGATQPTPQVLRRHTACNGELQPSRAASNNVSEANRTNVEAKDQVSYSQQSQPFSDGFHHAGW